MRAGRIGIGNDECLIYPETLLENIVNQIGEHRPDLVVIDSIQTIYTDLLDSSAGKRVADTRMRGDRCSNTPNRPARRSSSSATSPRTERSPAPRFWNTSWTWCCSSKGDSNNDIPHPARHQEPFRRNVRNRGFRDARQRTARAWTTRRRFCSRTTRSR